MDQHEVQSVFTNLIQHGRKALIPYITAGDPELAVTEEIVMAMVQAGADIVELGVPTRSVSRRRRDPAGCSAGAGGENLIKYLSWLNP